MRMLCSLGRGPSDIHPLTDAVKFDHLVARFQSFPKPLFRLMHPARGCDGNRVLVETPFKLRVHSSTAACVHRNLLLGAQPEAARSQLLPARAANSDGTAQMACSACSGFINARRLVTAMPRSGLCKRHNMHWCPPQPARFAHQLFEAIICNKPRTLVGCAMALKLLPTG